MAPKRDTTPQKGKGSTSKKGKGKEQEREKTPPPSDDNSSSEYQLEDDLPTYEELEYTLQSTSSKRKKSSWNSSIFVEVAAQERWELGMATKLLHLERGFTIDEEPFKSIMEFHRFDKKLTAAPTHCNTSLVREFYANAKFPDDKGAYFVRGRRVQITSEVINTYLGTPNHPSDPLHYPKNAELDEALLNELAVPGAEWVLNSKGAHLYIRWESLRSEVKIWQKFVEARLMPSAPTAEVNRRRLFLLSAIMGKYPIDAGQIILACIKVGIDRDNAALFFPGLIEELCAAQGVDVRAGEWRQNQGPISTSLYQKYVSQERGLMQDDLEIGTGMDSQQTLNFRGFHGVLQNLQRSMDAGFRHMDERMKSMNDQGDDRYRELVARMEKGDHTYRELSTRLDDMSSVAQQQFEVLYHRQMMMHAELDKCNKMAVFYHSSPELPKPIPTPAQLQGCQVPHLSSNVVSGEVQAIPPGVTAVPSFGPLPTFGSLPHVTPPMFTPSPSLMPSERIPYIASGQPLQGAHLGLTHWRTSPLAGASFATTTSLSPPMTSVPPSFQGAPQP